mmetsp:Transcript_14496/g.50461  ORF Transcript_14496/g.50461 Transcript_14496/m.50461 type:complete len:225 (+) Transcript_14496:54-728(+)
MHSSQSVCAHPTIPHTTRRLQSSRASTPSVSKQRHARQDARPSPRCSIAFTSLAVSPPPLLGRNVRRGAGRRVRVPVLIALSHLRELGLALGAPARGLACTADRQLVAATHCERAMHQRHQRRRQDVEAPHADAALARVGVARTDEVEPHALVHAQRAVADGDVDAADANARRVAARSRPCRHQLAEATPAVVLGHEHRLDHPRLVPEQLVHRRVVRERLAQER